MNRPKISVVIPVYNVEKYLGECLGSVFAQTLCELEIVCVDDGSTDSSLGILNDYAARDSRVRIITKSNGGLSSARNAALREVTGQYVLFLDSDDRFSPEGCARLYEKAAGDKLDVLFYDADAFADSPEAEKHARSYVNYYRRNRSYATVRPGAELIAEMMSNGDYLCSACFEIWRTDFLRAHDLAFSEGILHEDTEFTFKAALLAERAAHLDAVFFHRRVRASGSIMTNGVRFASAYGAFRAFLGMESAYALLGREVAGGEWLVKEMDDVLFTARDRHRQLSFAERAKLAEVSDLRFHHLYQSLVAMPADGVLRPAPIVQTRPRPADFTIDETVKVSVVIPVYNMGKFLSECLDSVLGQTLREIEVLCVDDGSTDDSPEILAHYAERDVRIRVFTQKNQGAYAARNKALDEACGQYVIFMDPDDWYSDINALQTLYVEAVANKVKICGGEIVEMLDRNTVKPLPPGYIPSYRYRRHGFFEYSEYQYFGWYTRFIFERRMIEENGIRFPPYARYQDPPFMVRAMIAAGRFYAVKRTFYAVRVEHKTINWQANGCRKLIDFMAGNADVFRMAKENGLERLFNRQKENLVSTGMLHEICKNLNLPAVRRGLEDLLVVMGPAAGADLLGILDHSLTTVSQVPTSSANVGKSISRPSACMGIRQRMIKCYHDEGFWYTLKRLLQLGRK